MLIKYKVTLSTGAYEEFLEYADAEKFANDNEGSSIDVIKEEEQTFEPSMEDVIVSLYKTADWQGYLDKLEASHISGILLTSADVRIQSTAWNTFNIIIQLLDWPIKQRLLINEYRTFCFLTCQLVPTLPAPLIARYLEILKETNVMVFGLEQTLSNKK
jgi:hypothetical protein